VSGWLFLGIGALATLLDFAAGLWLLRRSADVRPRGAEGMEPEADPSARVGRLIMFVSPLFLLVFALLAFGLIPFAGIEPITFGGGQ
jgi:hypothetical protein